MNPYYHYNSKVLHLCCIGAEEADRIVTYQENEIMEMRELFFEANQTTFLIR